MTKNISLSLFKTGLSAGIALIAIAPQSNAQSGSPSPSAAATTLAPIVVEGSGEAGGTGPVRGYVAKQSTTGSKTATAINRIPQSVSVIGREELEDRAVTSKVDEALQYTAGVVAQPYGADPDTDWIYIRGFEASQTGVSVDNLPFTSTAYGNFQIDAFMQERIEVLKGPASVLVGGANAGGVVNIVRKRPTPEDYFYTEIGINSDGNGFTGFDVSKAANQNSTAQYRVTGKIAGGKNYVDSTSDLRGFIMPQVSFAPNDATNLNVYAYLSRLDQIHTTNGLLPYMGTVVANPIYGKIGRSTYLGDKASDIGRANQALVGYELSHEFDSGVTVTQSARYGNLNKRERYIYAFDFDQKDALIGRYAEDIASKANAFNLDNRLEAEAQTAGLEHKLMAGIDYRYYRLDTNKYAGFPTSVDPKNLGVPTSMPTLTAGTNQIVSISQVGIYGQDQIRFGDGWLVTLNGRYDFLHSEGTDLSKTLKDYKSDRGALSGRAGIAYEFDNGLTPYASAASFFSPLVGTSVDGALKPENGTQYEVGLKYEPTDFDGLITASLFQIDKDNYTVNIPGVGDKQLGSVRSRGFELEGKVNLDENWKAIASTSYNDVAFTKYPGTPALVGKSPYLVPSTGAALWLDYTVTDGPLTGFGIGAGARYRGKSYADNENTLKVSSATVIDAGIRYEKNDWKASLNVSNLFDNNYVSGCATQYFCGYGQARTFTIKLSKVW